MFGARAEVAVRVSARRRISRGSVSSGTVVTPDERMSFGYGAFDRLVSAAKTTTDDYMQSYGYNAIGNLTGLASVTQGDNDPLPKHAITHLNGA